MKTNSLLSNSEVLLLPPAEKKEQYDNVLYRLLEWILIVNMINWRGNSEMFFI